MRVRTPIHAVLAGALLLAACGDLTVPDYNNPSLEELQSRPTPTAVSTAATGLLVGARMGIADRSDFISVLGVLGRESYVFDGSEPRYITELLIGPLDPGGFLGGGLFAERYRNIRNANILLNALESPELVGLSDAEKEAIRGFAKTIQALDYLLVIDSRDVLGAPIDVDRAVGDEPAPIATREQVFEHVETLLDQAAAHLRAGGARFPFPLSTGFQGFDTPLTFLEFNRALAARVNVYREQYQEALLALDASFLDLALPLDYGVYYTFGVGSGDTPNDLINAAIFAHPSIVADAERQVGGELDRRVLSKVVEVEPRTVQGVTSNLKFKRYDGAGAPIPITRNEELILLKAETLWGLGRLEESAELINLIRVKSGGLAPIPGLAAQGADAVLEELLQQRRFSLLFEGGHRLIDLRRFDRLGEIPLALPSHNVIAQLPIPRAECLARGIQGECRAGS